MSRKKPAGCFLNSPELFPKNNGVQVDQSERLLPKPVFDNSDGDPVNYQVFIRQFGSLMRTNSDEVRLLLLLKRSEPDVHDKVNRFPAKDPTEGYRLTWQTLYTTVTDNLYCELLRAKVEKTSGC